MKIINNKKELSPIYDSLFDDLNASYTKEIIKDIKKNDIKSENKNREEEISMQQ